MPQKNKIVFFLTDTSINPHGINAGGGETASLSLAKALASFGEEVIVCGNLECAESVVDGITFWNFGTNYDISSLSERLNSIGAFHCLSATFVHPFLLLKNHKNCVSRVIINHSPSIFINGLSPQSVINQIDTMVCVSEAQKNLHTEVLKDESKFCVIKNGFDPTIFIYQGPDNRDYSHVVIVGRVERWKGSHLLFDFFPTLKSVIPDLKMTFIGDYSEYPGLKENISKVEHENPGLRFVGKRSQLEISEMLRTSGLLLFPSVVFESAGLAVVDAQASGCPVVAFGTGGVSEYLFNNECGKLVKADDYLSFYQTVITLMQNPEQLKAYSRNCEHIARKRTWNVVAQEVIDLLTSFT
jgi:glycosyltransferase involved in cell wall biosynthesis